jgi:hypothetical protein
LSKEGQVSFCQSFRTLCTSQLNWEVTLVLLTSLVAFSKASLTSIIGLTIKTFSRGSSQSWQSKRLNAFACQSRTSIE